MERHVSGKIALAALGEWMVAGGNGGLWGLPQDPRRAMKQGWTRAGPGRMPDAGRRRGLDLCLLRGGSKGQLGAKDDSGASGISSGVRT